MSMQEAPVPQVNPDRHNKMVQKIRAARWLILHAVFTAFLMESAGAHARLGEGFYVFDGERLARELKEKELERLRVPYGCTKTAPWFGGIAIDPKDAQAQFDVGVMYETGRDLPQDYGKAASCYRMAAAQGHADAQNNLGWLYENGKGVSLDYGEATSWYREAAAQGHADAQFNLGVMYYSGRGIARDLVQAHMWFSLSEKAIGQEASNSRKSAEAEMTLGQIVEAQQLAREWSEIEPQMNCAQCCSACR